MDYIPVEQFDYTTVQPVIFSTRRNKIKALYSDNIVTFDIETVNLYRWPDGSVTGFDRSLTPDDYKVAEKMGFMVIWQANVDGQNVFGRSWESCREFFEKIRDRMEGATWLCWIHNLGFEFQFLRNIIDDWQVFARENYRPMKAYSPSMRLELRCTQMLTNQKLEEVPDMFGLDVTKAVGSWDYDAVRTPLTPLSDQEMDYAIRDVVVCYKLIQRMVEEYKHVVRIPLTNTSRLRRECLAMYAKKFWTRKKIADQNEDEPYMYRFLVNGFSGGYAHANAEYVGKILRRVGSLDVASDYPSQMVMRMFPWGQFKRSKAKRPEDLNPRFAYILRVRIHKLTSRYHNHYISWSRCLKRRGTYCDNGRIVMSDMVEMIITDVDLDIIRRAYLIDRIEILEAYCAPYRYMDETYVAKVLDLYAQKTKLKGVVDPTGLAKREYNAAKVKLNSLYGMCVTRSIRDEVVFADNEWKEEVPPDTEDVIREKLKKYKDPNHCFLNFAAGVWITAWARKTLWDIIMTPGCDDAVVYNDTDSIKYLVDKSAGRIEAAAAAYNKSVDDAMRHALIWQGLDPKAYRPKDIKGVEHPLGYFENEGVYDRFRTWGSKKYATETDGKIETTVAGLSKDYIDENGKKRVFLKDLKDFKIGMTWDWNVSGRTTSYYNNNQPVVTVDGYKFKDLYGICIMPAYYTLGVTGEFLSYYSAHQKSRDHTGSQWLEGVPKIEKDKQQTKTIRTEEKAGLLLGYDLLEGDAEE